MNDLRNGALRLLAENPDGCTANRMVAHGFTLELGLDVELNTAKLWPNQCKMSLGPDAK